MKKHLTVFLILLLAITVYSQDSTNHSFHKKNSLQIDIGGPGLLYSINYERILLNGNRFKTASQVGVSYYPPKTGMRDIWIPIGINELFSFGNHHLEAGIGYLPIREATRDPELQV